MEKLLHLAGINKLTLLNKFKILSQNNLKNEHFIIFLSKTRIPNLIPLK